MSRRRETNPSFSSAAASLPWTNRSASKSSTLSASEHAPIAATIRGSGAPISSRSSSRANPQSRVEERQRGRRSTEPEERERAMKVAGRQLRIVLDHGGRRLEQRGKRALGEEHGQAREPIRLRALGRGSPLRRVVVEPRLRPSRRASRHVRVPPRALLDDLVERRIEQPERGVKRGPTNGFVRVHEARLQDLPRLRFERLVARDEAEAQDAPDLLDRRLRRAGRSDHVVLRLELDERADRRRDARFVRAARDEHRGAGGAVRDERHDVLAARPVRRARPAGEGHVVRARKTLRADDGLERFAGHGIPKEQPLHASPSSSSPDRLPPGSRSRSRSSRIPRSRVVASASSNKPRNP